MGEQNATTQSITKCWKLPDKKDPFCWSSKSDSGNFCHWNSSMWMQTKSPTGNGDRAHMGNREAADEGKKVLSHCCFSWSSDSRIVPGKFGCCFCYLYSEPTGTEYIVYSGLELRDPWGWEMHHRHAPQTLSWFLFSQEWKGQWEKGWRSVHRYQLPSPILCWQHKMWSLNFYSVSAVLLGSYTEHYDDDDENCYGMLWLQTGVLLRSLQHSFMMLFW